MQRRRSFRSGVDAHLCLQSRGGCALYADGEYSEAEKVFRADLERNRLSGRSLFGLMLSLKAQKKLSEAASVQKDFAKAWKNADVKLSLGEL
jgi:hypothetical protein